MYKECIKKIHNLYEPYNVGEKVRLVLDIDINNDKIPKEMKRKDYFESILNDTINLMQTKLQNYDFEETKKPEYIILSACTKDKLSAHIIYPKIVFDDIRKIKYFLLDSDDNYLIKNGIIDISIYCKKGLRIIWCNKYDKENTLELYRYGNCSFMNYTKKLFLHTLVKPHNDDHIIIPYEINEQFKNFIKNKDKKQKIIKDIKKNNENDNKKEDNADNEEYTSLKDIQAYVDMLNLDRCYFYKQWIDVGIILYNCNPNSYDIWNEWSKKVEKKQMMKGTNMTKI